MYLERVLKEYESDTGKGLVFIREIRVFEASFFMIVSNRRTVRGKRDSKVEFDQGKNSSLRPLIKSLRSRQAEILLSITTVSSKILCSHPPTINSIPSWSTVGVSDLSTIK